MRRVYVGSLLVLNMFGRGYLPKGLIGCGCYIFSGSMGCDGGSWEGMCWLGSSSEI